MATANQPKFFSLKWKAGILFSGLLLILNAFFPALVYWDLHQKFNLSRLSLQQQYHQELRGQLKTTSDNLQRLAESILIPDTIGDTDPKQIIRLLYEYQNDLKLNWNVALAHYLNSNNTTIGGWGEPIPNGIQHAVTAVSKTGSPTTYIDCSIGCMQYDLIPILTSNQQSDVLIIAYDLSNTLEAFHHETGADLAILSINALNERQHSRYLPAWNSYISALTSYKSNLPLLHSISERFPDINAILGENKILRDDSLSSEFQPLTPSHAQDIFFVIIDNIADEQERIRAVVSRSIIIALVGVLLVGGGLFFFLSSPLTRLSNVSRTLPLLAKQRYNEARQLIRIVKNEHKLDELDLLENSTVDLTNQLEQLHQSVKERTTTINKRSVELQQERDFIKSLIDTAQLIIITIDRNCNITSFNRFAEQTTGYLKEDIINMPISRLLPSSQWPEIQRSLSELKDSPNAVSQQESEFLHSDGSVHLISWLHSSLTNHTDNAVILSVGLDITKQKQSEGEIVWLADHDVLTELYNRRKFNIEFSRLLQQAERFNHQGALLFLDLDQFKDINDSCGHKVGDQLLKQVAQTIQSVTRTTDIVARFGGDEFAIISPETDQLGAINLAEKIAAELALVETNYNGVRYKISSSIGIIQFPLGGLSVEELISNADLAMYKAKAKGKSTWHQFSLDDHARIELEARVLWKQKIEDALEHNRFILHYQPIMDIRTRTIKHYEVLLRMQNADQSISLPGTFIQVAEQTGLIHHIDHYVLRKAILKQAELQRDMPDISLSINLSGHAVNDQALIPLLEALLIETGANPERLIFELTETAAVADILQAKEFMLQLHKLGCRFSLDDFGTGFSSFRYMRELPVDIVKIDGSFITDLAQNTDDQLFVKALVDVAQGMGKKTVAEFVENTESLSLLHAFGVDYAQGFYIGKPDPQLLLEPLVLK